MKAIVGEKYKHYKNGHEYVVLALAHHTETGECMVVYQGQYDTEDLGKHPVFVRPQEMFEDTVELEGRQIDRFTKISNS